LVFFGDRQDSLRKAMSTGEIVTGAIRIKTKKIVLAEQTHSDIVRIVDKSDSGKGFISPPVLQADALITCEKDLFLAVKTADCYPILIHDKELGTVAVIHSGRAGCEFNITGKVIQSLMSLGCKAEDLLVKIGPGICEEHYFVADDCFEEFIKKTDIWQKRNYLDLRKVIINQLLCSGILDENISVKEICTFEESDYFSYRRDKTEERQVSLIGIISRETNKEI